MARIFVSYRRSCDNAIPREIVRYMKRVFGHRHVFLDSQSIEGGDQWEDKITKALSHCEVFIAVVADGWNRDNSLHNEADWVRREVEAVLKRNATASPGDGLPVHIETLLVGEKTEMPKAPTLPEALHAFCGFQATKCPSDVESKILRPVLNKLVHRIDKHLGEPSTGEFGFHVWSSLPGKANQDGFHYRYRAVTKRDDLEPFVTLSDNEYEIAGANPELTSKKRWKLYEKWCQLTARDPDLRWTDPGNEVKSFLILDRRQSPDGEWKPIGVSIILPLSHLGYELLMEPPPRKKVNALSLEPCHLKRGPLPPYLLLDTLIRGQKEPGKKPIVRHEDHHWGIWLVMRHLAEFWNPKNGNNLTFMIEPDNPKIEPMMIGIGFNTKTRNKKSGPILYFDYPPPERLLRNRDYSDHIQEFKDNFEKWMQIEITRTP